MPLLKRAKDEASKRSFPEDPEEFRLTLVEHLEELRDRLIKVVAILVVGWFIGWFIFPSLYKFLDDMVTASIKPALPKGADYRDAFTSLPDAFMLKLKLSFLIGMVGAFPLIVLQLWSFIAPALKPSERKPFKRLAPLSLLLFLIGASFAWLTMPAALNFLAGFLGEFQSASLFQQPGTMAFFILKMLLAFGIAFQLPLVVYALGALDLLQAETMLQYWRQVTASIFILSAIITPSQDPLTMTIMALPLVVLFLISAFFVKRLQKRRKIEAELPHIEEEHYSFE